MRGTCIFDSTRYDYYLSKCRVGLALERPDPGDDVGRWVFDVLGCDITVTKTMNGLVV